MEKLVTFSIPIYNIPKEQIEQCVDSLLDVMKETDKIEAFVVENASTDETIWPWLKEKYDNIPNLNLVKFEKNNGKPPTTMYSINKANGKWLIILDSDDFIDKDEFMKLMPELEKINSDAIFTDYVYYFDDKKKSRRRNMHFTNKYVKEMPRMYWHMWHFDHSIIHNVEFLRKNNFSYPSDMTAYEDIYNNMFVLSKAKKLFYVKTAFYQYRIRQKGKNMTSCEAMMRKNHEFTEVLYALIDLDYTNPYTKAHMSWYFSLQMMSVMFFYDMKHKRWFPLKTRNKLKKIIRKRNPELWKMLSAKNVIHWTPVGFLATIATPFWRLAQIFVKWLRP